MECRNLRIRKLNELRRERRLIVRFDKVVSDDEPEDPIPIISSFLSQPDPPPETINSFLMHVPKLDKTIDTVDGSIAVDQGISGIDRTVPPIDAGVWQSLIMESSP